MTKAPTVYVHLDWDSTPGPGMGQAGELAVAGWEQDNQPLLRLMAEADLRDLLTALDPENETEAPQIAEAEAHLAQLAALRAPDVPAPTAADYPAMVERVCDGLNELPEFRGHTYEGFAVWPQKYDPRVEVR